MLAGNLHQFCAALKIETWKLPQIEPMMLSRVAAPFDHPDFLFELKQDGFRCIAYISESGCDLVSRCKYSYKSFDSLKTALAKLKAMDAILDGEICCLDSQGRSQFNELLYRRGEPVLYCFDLLWLNGQDLRQLQLIERKKQLHVLRFVEKYFFDGLAKNASNLESEAETGIVFPGLDGNDGGAGDTNALGEFCLRPFAVSS